MESKSRSVNYFEIVKIDVLEAWDYVDRVPDVNLFLFTNRTSIFERFMKILKICKNMHDFCKIMHDFCKNMHDFWENKSVNLEEQKLTWCPFSYFLSRQRL